MAFSAVLGLVSGIGQMVMAGQQYAIAQEELQLKRQALRDQKDMAMLQYGAGQDQLKREREQEAYLRQINERNERTVAAEMERVRQEREMAKQQALSERQYMIDRQMQVDRAAAEQRAFQIEQYLSNQNLAAEEREYALSQLADAQAVARGERDTDLRMYAEEREMAQIEREWAIQQFEAARQNAYSDRQYDMQYRNNLIDKLGGMTSMLETAFADMPALTAPAAIGEDEIASTIAMFENNAIMNVDRAAEMVASANEGELIKRGIDNSTTGTARRGDVAARLSQEYQNAVVQARTQAMSYIQGKQDLAMSSFDAQLKAREATGAHIKGIYGPEIDALMQLPQLRSANDFQAPVQIGSGVYSRGIASANNYQAPVQIGTGIYDNMNIGFGMGDTMNLPSVADAYRISEGLSAVQTPQMWQISSPGGYFGNAASLQQGIAGQHDPQGWLSSANDWYAGGLSSIGKAAGSMSFGQAGISNQTGRTNYLGNDTSMGAGSWANFQNQMGR